MTLTKVRDRGTTGISTDLSGVNNSLSRLGLRVIANQNLAGINGNDISYDTFQDSTKIQNLTNTARDSSEYISSISFGTSAYETGDRSSVYTVTSANITISSGSVSNSVDGNLADGSGGSWYWSSASVGTGDVIVFDLGTGNSKIFVGARWRQNNNDANGNWVWQGSNDGTNYTDLSSGFALGGQNTTETEWTNTTAYRYIRLRGVSGTRSSGSWNNEIEFKVTPLTANATGSFEGTSITAGASTNKMGAVLTYTDTSGTASLNTDLILDLSADNGSNYNRATLTALPDFASGVKCCKVNDLDITNAGTQLKYKISFQNQSSGSKETRVTGVSLQY